MENGVCKVELEVEVRLAWIARETKHVLWQGCKVDHPGHFSLVVERDSSQRSGKRDGVHFSMAKQHPHNLRQSQFSRIQADMTTFVGFSASFVHAFFITQFSDSFTQPPSKAWPRQQRPRQP